MRVTPVWHLGFLASGHPRLKVLESPANQDSILFVFVSWVWTIFGRNHHTPDALILAFGRVADFPSVDVGVGHQFEAVVCDRLACADVFGNTAGRHAVLKAPQ